MAWRTAGVHLRRTFSGLSSMSRSPRTRRQSPRLRSARSVGSSSPTLAQRELVDDHDVGLELLGGGQRDARAQRAQLVGLELEAPRAVVAVGVAAAPRELDRVDAGREAEGRLDRRTGEDQ